MIPYNSLVILIIGSQIITSYCDCSFQLDKTMDSRFQPVYFIKEQGRKSYSLAVQERRKTRHFITVNELETLIITCPNTIIQADRFYEVDMQLLCKNETFEITLGKEKLPKGKQAQEYHCANETGFNARKATEKDIKKQCKSLSFGELYSVGLYTYMWFTLYWVCYVNQGVNPIYATYSLNAEKLKNRQMGITEWKDTDMRHPLVNYVMRNLTYSRYEKENIWKQLTRKYDRQLNSYFDVENHHFVPLALVPENEMSFLSWRYASHLSLNIIPVWKQITCTWRTIENYVKLAAIRINSTLDIYTGILKNLTLQVPWNQSKELEVRLGEVGEIKVPEIVWKLVYNKDSKEAIIFILHNNPYQMDGLGSDNKICESVCKSHGWRIENGNARLGQAYCCDANVFFSQYKEFKKFKTFFEIDKILSLPFSKIEIESD